MQPRDYQIDIANRGLEIINEFGLVYLAMQVRCGKTLTSLLLANKLSVERVLFVTKKKAISSIEDDFKLSGFLYKLEVINYESVHKCNGDYDLIIIDEAHSLGQYPIPSERTKALKELCKGKPVIFLSGTPSPESLAQLFHQFWVSDRSPFKDHKNFYGWHKVYGIPKKKFVFNRELADYSHVKMEMIESDTAHLFLTYTQIEAGFESLVEEAILYVPMSDKVKWAINKITKDKLFKTKDGQIVVADTAVKEMQKVHQICSGTVKTEDGNAIIFDDTKARFIKEKFKGQKIAIFYKYIAEGLLLKSMFNNVYDDPQEFNKADDGAVFISQVQSGREGINLSTADALVMYNIDFSAVSYWQSRARMQTKDRTDASKVYWVFTRDGIEDRIFGMVQAKKDFTLRHFRKVYN
jgi:superfamily II DNA or RNA helicase